MRYKIYIDENNNLIWKKILIKKYKFPLNEIKEFTIDKVRVTKGYDPLPTYFAGSTKTIFFRHVLKNPMGNIVICFKENEEKTKINKSYRTTITKYKYIRIENIANVFKVAKQLIDYGIHYCDRLVYREVNKLYFNKNKSVVKTYSFTSRGKSKFVHSHYCK